MSQANPDQPLLAGSLSSRRRTIVGVIGQFALLGLDAQVLAGVLSEAGLPHARLMIPTSRSPSIRNFTPSPAASTPSSNGSSTLRCTR